MCNELKSCPFCGSEAEFVKVPGAKPKRDGTLLYGVACKNIDCAANIGNYYGKKTAADAWNRRVINKDLQEQGEIRV